MHNLEVIDKDSDNILDGKKKLLLNDGEFEEIDPSEFYLESNDKDELDKRNETHMELVHHYD